MRPLLAEPGRKFPLGDVAGSKRKKRLHDLDLSCRQIATVQQQKCGTDNQGGSPVAVGEWMIPGDAESIGGGKLADLRVIVRGEIFRSIADSSMGASWSPLPTFNRASASFGRMTPAELPTVVIFNFNIKSIPMF